MSTEGPPFPNQPDPSQEGGEFEIPQNSEDLEDDALKDLVLRSLKEKGVSHEGVKQLLIQWASRRERSAQTVEDRVIFEVERAKIYLDAGYHDEGVQALEDARTMAEGEGLDNLVEEINSLWDAI